MDDPVPMNTMDKLGYMTGKFEGGFLRAPQSAAQTLNYLFYDTLSVVADALMRPYLPEVGDYLKSLADDSYNIDAFGADAFQRYFDDTFKHKEVSDALEFTGDLFEGAGSLLPNLAAGHVAGAAGLGETATRLLQMGYLGTTSAGGAAKEALSEGASPDEAFEYGFYKGLLDVGTENLFSGIEGLSEAGVMNKLLGRLRANGTLRYVTDVLGEGAEEAITTFFTPYIKRAVYDPAAADATAEEMLRAAASGAFLSAATKAGAYGAKKLGDLEDDIRARVDFGADKAEYAALQKLRLSNLPLSVGDYTALKHGDPERWNDFVRRAVRQRPEAVEVFRSRMLAPDAAGEEYRRGEAEEDRSQMIDKDVDEDYTQQGNTSGESDNVLDNETQITNLFNNGQRNRFASDPIRQISGPISESHPEIMEHIVNVAQEYGVEVISANEENIAYSPGLQAGQPGQLHLNTNNSYGAWLHEYKHMMDDANDGWPGFEEMFNTERRIRMEREAYAIEIQIAEDLGRKDIADALKVLRDEEIRHIISELGGEP